MAPAPPSVSQTVRCMSVRVATRCMETHYKTVQKKMETLFQDDEGMVMVMGMGIVFLDMYARFKEAEHWISLITESEMYE